MKNEKHDVQQFWNQNPCGGEWISYREKIYWLIKTEPYLLNLIPDDLLNTKKVLEVGCGQGFLLSLIAPKCKTITGLDLSKNSLLKAKIGTEQIGIKNVTLVEGDAENLPFANNAFDVVYSIGVLHHTPSTKKAIDEIYRVLKPDGTAIVMLYRKHTPKWLATITLRGIAKFLPQKPHHPADHKKALTKDISNRGTALQELFACPILKCFSHRDAKNLFKQFNHVHIKNYQPGFTRLIDFLPFINSSRTIKKIFKFLDKIQLLGFYMVITATK